MIFLLTVWYPGDKTKEVGKKFFDAAGKLPPFIKKWQAFGSSGGLDGMKAYHLVMTERDKGDEALFEINKMLVPFLEIEGYKIQIEPLMGMKDAAKLMQV